MVIFHFPNMFSQKHKFHSGLPVLYRDQELEYHTCSADVDMEELANQITKLSYVFHNTQSLSEFMLLAVQGLSYVQTFMHVSGNEQGQWYICYLKSFNLITIFDKKFHEYL